MKIKVCEKNIDDVLRIEKGKHVYPKKQTPFFRWLLKTVSSGEMKAVDFEKNEIGMDRLRKDEPCLILMNHSSFTDLQIIATVFSDRQYHIVCTNDGFVNKEWLMHSIGCIPAKKFITDVSLVRDMKYCFDKLKSSVVMYPEASYTFDGTATPLPDSVAKSIKFFRVPVVMVRTHGAFLRDPLYNNLKKRDVKVTADIEYLFSSDDIKTMDVSDIQAVLDEKFSYDHFREQYENGIEIDETFRAEGLERVLYKCPKCLSEGTLKGEGVTITCSSCGKVWTLETNGKLKAEQGDTDFEFVSDWYSWERDEVKKEIISGTYSLERECDILIYADNKAMYNVGKGIIKHSCDGFHLTGCDGKLDYTQSSTASYSLYADYFWYEIGDVISIGDTKLQYYCFPKTKTNVAKCRLAAEELYKHEMTLKTEQ